MDNIVILHFSLPEVAIRHCGHDITHVAQHFSHYEYLGKCSEAGPEIRKSILHLRYPGNIIHTRFVQPSFCRDPFPIGTKE